MNDNTIAAIATGLVGSGISIIRISGEAAISIADSIFSSPSGKKLSTVSSHTINYGYIVDNGEIYDEVMVSVMRAPKTYTREDIIEINCHGGIAVTKRVFDLVISRGAAVAEPGEFTKRAFLNGRIDLTEAEAVIDVINSKNYFAVRSSLNNLTGRLSNLISEVRSSILSDTAFIEAALDDPEHIEIEGFSDTLQEHVASELSILNKLYSNFDNGRFYRDGIKTVIIGKPNAGKSSLLNLLLGQDRAIVTEVAGTTRDIIEEVVNIDGITLNIVDTAGIRDTDDIVERIGVEKSKDIIADADLILYVVDSSSGIDDNDRTIIDLLGEKRYIVLYNKVDLNGDSFRDSLLELTGKNSIDFSAKSGYGLENLKNLITEMFFSGELLSNDEIFLSNERQKNYVKSSITSLTNVLNAIASGVSEDFYTIDLMDAYTNLGYITGEDVEEDLVNKIFSDFCMGK